MKLAKYESFDNEILNMFMTEAEAWCDEDATYNKLLKFKRLPLYKLYIIAYLFVYPRLTAALAADLQVSITRVNLIRREAIKQISGKPLRKKKK